jgi:hypothetical protein
MGDAVFRNQAWSFCSKAENSLLEIYNTNAMDRIDQRARTAKPVTYATQQQNRKTP